MNRAFPLKITFANLMLIALATMCHISHVGVVHMFHNVCMLHPYIHIPEDTRPVMSVLFLTLIVTYHNELGANVYFVNIYFTLPIMNKWLHFVSNFQLCFCK